LPAAQDVKVEVVHGLPAVAATVDNHAVAIVELKLGRDCSDHGE
jgi:hypothetical protein